MGFQANINSSVVKDKSGYIQQFFPATVFKKLYTFSDNFDIPNTSDPTINDNWAKSSGEVDYFITRINSNTLEVTNGNNDSIVYYAPFISIEEPTAQVTCNPGGYESAGLIFSSDIYGNNCYRIEIVNGTGNGLRVKRSGGAGEQILTTYIFTPDGGYYNIKANLIKSDSITTIQAKYWDTDVSEPVDWQINISDDDAIIAGTGDYCGVTVGWEDSVNFDNFNIEWQDW